MSTKQVTQVGIRAEENLLEETAHKEALLIAQIANLESELRGSQQSLERVTSEYDRLAAMNAEHAQQMELLVAQRKQLKKEVKEYKFRESRNMADLSELEEENISLQKQVLQLKQAQVEFEGMKYENKRLKEDVEELNAELDELAKLKTMVGVSSFPSSHAVLIALNIYSY